MYVSPASGTVEVLRQSMATVVNFDHCVVHTSPGNSAGPGVTGFPDPVGVRYYILGAATLYSNVLTSHYENDAYEEPGAIDPQIALWRVLEQLPALLAEQIKSMEIQRT